MSYTFVRISNYYEDYLASYYQRHPELNGRSYDDHHRLLMDDAFGWSDFYAKGLSSLGVDAHEIIFNATLLQKAWATENGMNFDKRLVLLEQLKRLKPTVIFWDSFVGGFDFIKYVKRQIKSVRLNIGYRAAPFSSALMEQYRIFDILISCTPGIVNDLTKSGLQCYRIDHAFDESILSRIAQDDQDQSDELVFIGNIIFGAGYHNNRIKLLEELVRRGVEIRIHAPFHNENSILLGMKQVAYVLADNLQKCFPREFIARLPVLGRALYWSGMPRKREYPSLIRKQLLPTLYGVAMYKALKRAKIGLNNHIDSAGDYAGNTRLFEVTGVGTCLVTDWKKNLRELFEPDTEVISYKSVGECIDKVRWLLNHPKEVARIGKAGQARTLKAHTYAKRTERLDEIIRRHL